MADTYVKSGQVLGFKTGTQAAVDTILAAGQGATHGSFYLTQDTHRLYVGNEDTSLSPVNEGIITVSSISALPTFSSADERVAAVGRFYYVSGTSNILCVYNGSSWVQINTNTNDTIKTVTYTADTTNNLIKNTVTDSGNHSASGYFKVAAGDGVAVSYGSTNVSIDGSTVAVPTITIAADYEIGVVTESSQTKVKLTSVSGTSNDTSFAVTTGTDTAGNTNITVANDSGNLKLSVRDTRNKTIAVTANATAGFDATLTDNYNNSVTTNFQPKITYGNTPVTVDFVNGTATLNTYTKGEVDDIMTGLNAMTYIGTYNAASTNLATAADTITYSNGTTTVSLKGETVDMHLGDTILAAATFTYNGVNVTKGSLLIARSTDGTENADGTIDPSKLTFDIVQSTVDTDTTYSFVEAASGNGIRLKDSNNNIQGGLLFTGGNDASGTTTEDLIKVTKTSETSNNGIIETITIKHKDVTRTDTTGTAINTAMAASSNSWQGSTTVPVVTGVTTDEAGHITGVETTSVTIRDTNTYFPSSGANVVTTSVYSGTDNKTVGVIANTLTLMNKSNSSSTATGYAAITSQSLSISDDDTQMTSSGGSQAASGLNIEMVWGSF